MKEPLVSVLMPVYNCERYLSEAIQSILNQTYTKFELLILNDGSNDSSQSIIDSFKDKRIIKKQTSKNIGYVNQLNFGISISRGKYIARMDADDICMPNRFDRQVEFLNSNLNVSLIASFIDQINDEGNHAGIWDDDRIAVDEKSIKKLLKKRNCIAHPSIMIRGNVLRKYNYVTYQYFSEDWDLWLTLISNGYIIEKINEPLLKYRIHENSVTQMSSKATKRKEIIVLSRYLWNKMKTNNFTNYDIGVALNLFKKIIRKVI